MTLAQVNRRMHLYLGLALLPWFFMYGASSIPFAHAQYFEARDAAKKLPLWTMTMDRTVDRGAAVPADGDAHAMRAFGAGLMRRPASRHELRGLPPEPEPDQRLRRTPS